MTYKVHVFTSAAWNYLPKVRILFESIKKHHPEWETHFLVADKFNYDFDIKKEPFDNAWAIDDLDIPNYPAWIFCHNIVELATALKPFLFKKLFSQKNVKKVIFLDPDIVVFSRLDEILDALNTSSIVLTPHLTAPEKSIHGIMDNEIETEEARNESGNSSAENTSEDENLSKAKTALEKTQDEIPLIITRPVNSDIDDIPFEIKNTDPEHLPKDSNNGEQLGLF
jgi:alpha-N-acetylglucosamine transferase